MKITREQINKIISMSENIASSDPCSYFLSFVEVVYNDDKMLIRASDGAIALREEFLLDENHVGRYYFGPDEIIQLKTALKLWPKFPSEFEFVVKNNVMTINMIQMKVNSSKESVDFPDIDHVYRTLTINDPVEICLNADLINFLAKAINCNKTKTDLNSIKLIFDKNRDSKAPVKIIKNSSEGILMPLRSI